MTYAMAVLEVNASMGLIVAAPTAGSAGVGPGMMLALQECYRISDQRIVDALFNAGAVGYLAMRNATVAGAVGGWQALVDETAKDQDTLALLRWLDESQQADKLFENQQLRQPIVRNGRAATVGYRPEVWEKWE